MASQQRFFIKRHDRMKSLTATLSDSNGPLNLTNTTVKFQMASQIGATPKVSANATIVNASVGQVRYDWGATDTDTAGNFYAEWQVTYPDTKQITVPNSENNFVVVILPDIA